MNDVPPPPENEIRRVAVEKMSRILGERRAHHLIQKHVNEAGAPLMTPQDLYNFGATLGKLGGIESAVGALLSARAVMLGASRDGA